MKTIDTDVLVVGGGPAGVIASYTVAKAGYKVMLADAKPHDQIGNKTCGDALDLKAPQFVKDQVGLELPHGDEVADLVKYLIFAIGDSEYWVRGDGFVVNRHVYGQRLLKEAVSAGVQVLASHKAKKSLVDGETVVGAQLVDQASRETVQVNAKITIDCSGRNFILRKTLPKGKFPYLEKEMSHDEIVASYREIIQLKDDHDYQEKIYLIYRDIIPEPGYFWIFTKGPMKLNVGIGWFMNHPKGTKDMKKIYRNVLHEYYKPDEYEVLDGRGYTIPTRYPLLNAVANGFMTAGDAAMHVDPLTAEGHGPALMAGCLAGKQAIKALDDKNYSMENLWEYNIKVMEAFGVRHFKSQVFAATLTDAGINNFAFVIKRKILTQDDFTTIGNGEDLGMSRKLRILAKMFPKYGLLKYLRRLADASRAFDELAAQYPKNPKDFPQWVSRFYNLMFKYGYPKNSSPEPRLTF